MVLRREPGQVKPWSGPIGTERTRLGSLAPDTASGIGLASPIAARRPEVGST
jgi:hypothetical protein